MAAPVTMAGLGLRTGDCVVGPALAPEAPVCGLTADSREVRPGMLFAALRGQVQHGVDHLPAAAAKGAVAALASPGGLWRALRRSEALPLPVLVDPAPRRRLAEMASRFWPEAPATCVLVTGTNGKTSSVDFLGQIWRRAGVPAAAIGTLGASGPAGPVEGASLTTPEPTRLHALLQRFAGEGATHVAMEASSHALDQGRLDGVRATVAVLTSFSRDHLDYHRDEEAYAAAKLRLFTGLPAPVGAVVANVDDPFGRLVLRLARARGAAVIPVGAHAMAADGLQLLGDSPTGDDGQAVTIGHDGREHRLRIPLAGGFQVQNALLAAAAAIAAGLAPEAALAALEGLRPVPGRMQLAARTAAGGRAYVDYAHTPAALDSALSAARRLAAPTGRVTVVFGAGGERDSGKRGPMGRIAATRADRVVLTDDNPRGEDAAGIREQIRTGTALATGAASAEEVADRRAAIAAALAGLAAGDVLVVAGKGHETVQEMAGGTRPFDDRAVIRALVDAAGGGR